MLVWCVSFHANHKQAVRKARLGAQVSKANEADRIEKLGVSRWVGLVLIAAWLIVLVLTIVFRRRTSYESRKELHWWEAFYRTGSIIFGGGQVMHPFQPHSIFPPIFAPIWGVRNAGRQIERQRCVPQLSACVLQMRHLWHICTIVVTGARSMCAGLRIADQCLVLLVYIALRRLSWALH